MPYWPELAGIVEDGIFIEGSIGIGAGAGAVALAAGADIGAVTGTGVWACCRLRAFRSSVASEPFAALAPFLCISLLLA